MAKDYLQYWKPETAISEFDDGGPLDHSGDAKARKGQSH
jgi:hypothetical protein